MQWRCRSPWGSWGLPLTPPPLARWCCWAAPGRQPARQSSSSSASRLRTCLQRCLDGQLAPPWSPGPVRVSRLGAPKGGQKPCQKNFFLQLFVSGSNTITMQHSPQFKGEDMGLWPCLALGQGTCKALKTRKGEGLILGQILRTTKHASSSTARPLPAVNFHLNGLSVSQNVVMQNTGDQLRNPKSQRVVHRDGGHPLCLDSGLERGPSFCLSAMSFACLWTWIDLPPTQREKTVRTIFSRKFLFL